MCILNPVPFHSDVPITAYKFMGHHSELDIIFSAVASNRYRIGETHAASDPLSPVNRSDEYDVGFHAYENIGDAIKNRLNWHDIVEVELSELTFKGVEFCADNSAATVYVANKCKFVKLIKMVE